MRITLFDLLLVLLPAVAVVCALVVAAAKVNDPTYVLLASRSLVLVTGLASVCGLFHPSAGHRAFAAAFLLACFGHLAVMTFFTDVLAKRGWPAYELLDLVWESIEPTRQPARWLQGSSHAAFRETGVWATSFLLGVVCGLVARALQRSVISASR
jgi:hypothetical protein